MIKKGDSLNLNKCLEIALKKHPQIIAAMNSLDVFKSKVGQSKADYYPQIKWNSDLSRNALPGNAPVSNEYSSSVSLNQNIFDFNRRGTQVDIQNLNLDSSRADLLANRRDRLFNDIGRRPVQFTATEGKSKIA